MTTDLPGIFTAKIHPAIPTLPRRLGGIICIRRAKNILLS